jgi:DNA-binding MarR family transcriptional regulator
MPSDKPLPETLTFRLGVLGSTLVDSMAERFEPWGITPRHAALLAVLNNGAHLSQLEVAAKMRVAPSLVVALANRLVEIGAIERSRDVADRRRQNLILTPEGLLLLSRCGDAASEVDELLGVALSPEDRIALERSLDSLMHSLFVAPPADESTTQS